jgi:glycine/D-amino acid oxidase-like deaminating enzyme
MEVAFEGWDAWNRRWEEPLYHQDGFLIMTRREMQPGSFEYDSFAMLQKRDHSVERLNSATLKARHPAWAAEQYPDGYFNPRAGWVASGKVVARLLQEAQAVGVQLREGLTMTHLLEEGSRVAGIVTTDNMAHRADFVLVAAGVWTPTLLPWLGKVMWATGQPVLHFRPHHPAEYQPPRFLPWAADVATTGWYGFPAQADGTLKVANHGPGWRIHPDAPRVVPPETEARFRAFFHDTFPDLAEAPLIGSRLCLYCDTWDGNFWIDHDPERPGLIVAAGDSGHGFKFAPVLGDLIADVLERRANPYAARFAWRYRGELTTEEARYGEATADS